MKVLTLVGLIGLASAATQYQDPEAEFRAFKLKYKVSYKSYEEESKRFQAFKDNLVRIEKHNSENHTWVMGVTKFADLTRDEFIATHLQGRKNIGAAKRPTKPKEKINLADLPASVDWRDQGVITGVRDQGQCGSCWAFASASQIATYAKINDMSHDLVELSPQHLTSCSPNPLQCGGSGGCMGSIEPLAYTYASLFGVVTEEEYPYTSGDPWGAGDDQVCQYDARETDVTAMTMGFETLLHNDIEVTMNHLANVGPLSASVAASDWGLYFGGVFDGCPYDENIAVNHAVQLIGYGTDPQLGDYWLIKNSWGDLWGDGWEDGKGGYIKLKRNSELMCGTDSTPLDGSACVDAYISEQHVCGTCAVLFDNSYPIGVTFMK